MNEIWNGLTWKYPPEFYFLAPKLIYSGSDWLEVQEESIKSEVVTEIIVDPYPYYFEGI